jgi:hypothetical protein|tara:strand:- start:2351 stop:2884 length:534 start_codon:yes stop_codon:yes gene_type:complete
MVRVELTPTELLMGHTIGTMRQAALQLSRNVRYDAHIMGARGEIAVAKALNVYWDSSVNSFKSRGDVGDIEVRTTTYVPPQSCSLYVTDRDHDDRRFVLVSQIDDATYQLNGWASGSDVKKRGVYESKAAGKPSAYWLRYDQLHDMDDMSEYKYLWQENARNEARALYVKLLKQRNI